MERSATGRNIKALRENNDLTQTEFAEKVGVTITTVSGWETRNIPPRQKMLAHIAELFGVSVDDLVSENGYFAKRSGINAATDPAQAKPVSADSFLHVEGGEDPIPCPAKYCREGNFFIVQEDESMNLAFVPGSHVLIDTSRDVADGDLALAEVGGGSPILRRLRLTDGLAILSPESTSDSFHRIVVDQTDPNAPSLRFLGRAVYASMDFGRR